MPGSAWRRIPEPRHRAPPAFAICVAGPGTSRRLPPAAFPRLRMRCRHGSAASPAAATGGPSPRSGNRPRRSDRKHGAGAAIGAQAAEGMIRFTSLVRRPRIALEPHFSAALGTGRARLVGREAAGRHRTRPLGIAGDPAPGVMKRIATRGRTLAAAGGLGIGLPITGCLAQDRRSGSPQAQPQVLCARLVLASAVSCVVEPPCRTANDANASAPCGAIFGPRRRCRDLAPRAVSHGPGAGIVSDGCLMRGASAMPTGSRHSFAAAISSTIPRPGCCRRPGTTSARSTAPRARPRRCGPGSPSGSRGPRCISIRFSARRCFASPTASSRCPASGSSRARHGRTRPLCAPGPDVPAIAACLPLSAVVLRTAARGTVPGRRSPHAARPELPGGVRA